MDFNKTLVAAVTLTGLITATNSHGATYAVSYTNISDFALTSSIGSASISGFSFSNAAVANDTGDSSATIDFGLTGSNATPSCIGNCAGLDDSFVAHTASDFIYGDALVASNNINAGIGQASAIGEANITSGSAFASGSNSLSGALLTIGEGGADFQFSFTVDSYMEVSGDGIGTAWSSLDISIGNNVWEWSPLSQSIGSGSNIFGGTPLISNTISLAEGTYSVSIAMDNNVNVSAVPVPAAVWLFGSGLIALAGLTRRKKSVK